MGFRWESLAKSNRSVPSPAKKQIMWSNVDGKEVDGLDSTRSTCPHVFLTLQFFANCSLVVKAYAQWFVPFYSRFLRIGGTNIKHQNTPNWLKAKCTKTCTLKKKTSISKYAQKMGNFAKAISCYRVFSLPCRLTEPIEKPHMCFPGPAGVPADSEE